MPKTVEEQLQELEAKLAKETEEKNKILAQTLDYKKKAQEAEERAKQAEQERELEHRKELERKGKFEEIAKLQATELANIKKQREILEQGQKVSAVIAALGGLKSPKFNYLVEQEVSVISMENGIPNEAQVKFVADKIRQEVPNIVATRVESTMTHTPGKGFSPEGNSGVPDLSKMSDDEMKRWFMNNHGYKKQ